MKASKHLEPCTEDCKFCPSGICAFSLRNSYGCYLNPEVQKIASEIYENAKTINTIKIAKSLLKGELL